MIARHIPGWSFAWLDARSPEYGACLHVSRRIALHPKTPTTWVLGTIIHEIAHALAGPAAGHGPDFLDQARRICRAENVPAHQAIGEFS